jgi:hypothetical protein
MDDGKEPIWLRMTIGAVFCFAESPWLTWEQLWCSLPIASACAVGPSYRRRLRIRRRLRFERLGARCKG